MVGETASGPALAVGPIIAAAGLPWVIGEPTNSTLTQRPENTTLYRVSPYDQLQTAFAVKQALLHGHKIALISDTSGFGQGGHNDLIAVLAASGSKPVADETYTVGAFDLTAQIARIGDSGADALISWSLAGDAAQIARTMRKQRLQIPMIGSWGLEGASFIKLAGPAADGVEIISVNPFYKNTPRVAAFKSAFDKKYGLQKMESPSYVAVSHDAMLLLSEGIRLAGSTDGKAILEALHKVNADGLIKNYRAPWSQTKREALDVSDLNLRVVKNGNFDTVISKQ
jgi:branched-chain amino acid transport system substrate-binding protein